MKCGTEKLSAWVDGDLPNAEAARVKAHVGGCVTCQRVVDELTALKRGLAALPELEAPDHWRALQQKLNAAPAPARWRWLVPVGATAMAAVLAVGAARVVRWHKGRGLSDDAIIAQAELEFRAADAQYEHAIERLRSVADKARAEWPAARRGEYDAAQAQLAAAIERCRGVAREHPADDEAEQLLFAAYKKQIRFLEDQMMRGPR
jgi:hypothetical protein